MDPLLRTRILSCPDLPTLPAVALEVLHLCQRDDLDVDAIAQAIARDPATAAKLLRLANSASFPARGRVGTLSRAIALVGTQATMTTALSFSLVRARRRSDEHGFDHPGFWRRSLFSAIAGRILGELHGLDLEASFLACLLQDIGMLALNAVFPGEYGQVCASASGVHDALPGLERARLGLDHVEIGQLLATRWSLPRGLRAALRGSHDPAVLEAGEPRHLADAAFLSGPLADVWVGAATPDQLQGALAAAERELRLDPDLVAATLGRMALAIPEASADFDLDLGGPAQIEAVLARAGALLKTRARGRTPLLAPGPAFSPDAVELVGEALRQARARGRPAAVALIAPLDPGDPAEVRALVASCLRRTDLLGEWHGAQLALLFDAAPRLDPGFTLRLHQRAAARGTPVAIGIVSLGGDGGPERPEALLEAAARALEASRCAGGAPARGSAAGPTAGKDRP